MSEFELEHDSVVSQRFVLRIEYDGTAFCGWQIQENDRTVQGEIEKALFKLYTRKIRLTGAGRTDAGVHASGQIAHFNANSKYSTETIQKALNFYLPEDVRILSCWNAPPEFHARFSARWRYYVYRLYKSERALFRQFGWHARDIVNSAQLNSVAQLLLGDHDFTAFCASDAVDDHHHCLVYKALWIEQADEYQFHIVANRFLKHMVRMLVGVSLDVARGRYPSDKISELFDTGDKGNLVITVPAQGLYLMTVGYGDFPFIDIAGKEELIFPDE